MELRLQADAIPPTEKVEQFGHDTISTFGIGAEFTEAQRHSVLRQLLAPGAVGSNKVMLDSGHSFDTLCTSESARAVLKGEMLVPLIESAAAPPERKRRSLAARRRRRQPGLGRAGALHQPQSLARRSGTRAWPATYVIFYDATLAAIAQQCLHTLDDLQAISGMGATKLEAYGADVLRVCAQSLFGEMNGTRPGCPLTRQ